MFLEILLFIAMLIVLVVFGTMAFLTMKDYFEERKQ